jgi:hypothetical protein
MDGSATMGAVTLNSNSAVAVHTKPSVQRSWRATVRASRAAAVGAPVDARVAGTAVLVTNAARERRLLSMVCSFVEVRSMVDGWATVVVAPQATLSRPPRAVLPPDLAARRARRLISDSSASAPVAGE